MYFPKLAFSKPSPMRSPTTFLLASLALALPAVTRAQGTADSVTSAGAPVRSDSDMHATAVRYAPTVRGCYEREGLRRDPTLDGTLTVSMTVLPDGMVRDVAVDTADVRGNGMQQVVLCVAAAAATWRFEQGDYAVERAELPFHCAPAATANTGDVTRGDSGAGGRSRTP
jgi:hypothetical protein